MADTITITKDQYDDAVIRVLIQIAEAPVLEGAGKVVFPMLGIDVAGRLRRILFGEFAEEEKTEE